MSNIQMEKLLKEHIVTIRGNEYKLRKVTKEELFEIRLSYTPGIVFKDGKELYYAALPKENLTLTGEKSWLKHLCSSDYECCTRLSADPNPYGCGMIRDRSFSYYKKYRKSKQIRYLCKISMRIEKYPFITRALETFGMKEDSLKILECKNCSRKSQRRSKVPSEKQDETLLALIQNLYPEINTMEKLRKKLDVLRDDDDDI